MPVSISDLKKAGVYSGAYKGLFSAPIAKKDPRIRKLEELLSARFKEVRLRNFETYRTFWAIDLLHETPFSQVNQTMIHALLAKKLDAKAMLEQLGAYGLSQSDLFLEVDVPGVGTKLIPNAPLFKQFVIPLVIAYHTVRTASIYAERDTSPQFKFTPLQQTDRNRVTCEIWTDIVDTIAGWYGYSAYKKQAIAQALKYGVMLAFPMEEWHCEKQMVNIKVDDKTGKITGDSRVQKEGLRYYMPHPTQMGMDLYHPAPTINTDTGCEWALHWDVVSYGSILDNRKYWNRSAITHSSKNWFDPAISKNYFQEFYPCSMRLPAVESGPATRTDKAAFYGEAHRDNAVFLGTQFFKLIPKDWGLSEYPYHVWHRFDMANDDTVIWAAPSAYTPPWFIGYDWDSNAGQHSSLSLELSAWQRELENIFTQMYLTAQENLVNLIYYDKNLVDKSRIDELKGLGSNLYRGMQFIDFDSLGLAKGAGLDARNAFHQVNFQQRSIAEFQTMMRESLNIMRTVLGFTAQETGSQTTHQISAKESGEMASSSNTRRNYTASGVDDGFEAWGRQIVAGAKAYLNNDIVAQVSSDIKDYEKHVKALGFEVKEVGDRKILVAGKKKDLPLETFARSNIGPTQPNDPQTAQAIMSALSIAFQNEQTFAQIGAKRIVKLLEQAVILGGGPRGFDITSDANEGGDKDPGALLESLKPAFAALQENILQTVGEKVVKPIAEQSAQEEQRIAALEAIAKQLQSAWQANGVEAAKLQFQQAESQQSMQIEQMKAQAEEQRKQEKHALEMQIATRKSGLESTIKVEKAGLDAQLATERTSADIALQEQSAAVDAANQTTLTQAKSEAALKAAAKKPAKSEK